jgi:alkyl hydroperoxide reductase subunit D
MLISVLRDKGVVEETILAVVRLASIIHGIGTVLEVQHVDTTEPALV